MLEQTIPAKPIWLRFLQFPLIRLVLLGGILFLMMGISNGFMQRFSASPLTAIAVAAAMAALALAVYAVFVTFIERRQVRELARSGMGRDLGIGLLIGAGLYTLCVVVLMMLGIYRIDGLNPWTVMLPAVAMSVSSGIFEELVFRGVLFRMVEEVLGSWIALAVSAGFFGFSHLSNPAGTVLGALSISIEAGLLLAAAYLVTRRLWLSIGLHMAWNYTQTAIFSGIVSGSFSQLGLIKSTIAGPDLLTGGSFGMEASLIAVLVCTIAGLVLLIIAIRRGNILPPFWQRVG